MHLSAPPSASSADTAELSVTTAPLDAAAVCFDGGSLSVHAIARVLSRAFPGVPEVDLLHWNPQQQRLQLLDLTFNTWSTVIPGHWVVVYDRGLMVLHPDLFQVLFTDPAQVGDGRRAELGEQLHVLGDQIESLSANLRDTMDWIRGAGSAPDRSTVPQPRAEDRLAAENLAPAAAFHVNGVAMFVGDVYRDWTGTVWTVVEASPDGIWFSDGAGSQVSWFDLQQRCAPLILEVYNGKRLSPQEDDLYTHGR